MLRYVPLCVGVSTAVTDVGHTVLPYMECITATEIIIIILPNYLVYKQGNVHVHAYIYMYMYTYACTCMYVCMYVCMCMCIT